MGFALINEYKNDLEFAKYYFHELSKQDNDKYNVTACNTRFEQLLKDNKQKIHFATILYLAKQKGFVFNNPIVAGCLPLATYFLRLLNYTTYFKRLDEIVLFEYMVTKARAFKGEFYHSASTIEKETRIKRTRQEKILNSFKKKGIIQIEKKGFPKVNHFTVNFDVIIDLLTDIYISLQKTTNSL